jgi:hypothetical protein
MFMYSTWAVVNLQGTSLRALQVYPNPAQTSVVLSVSSDNRGAGVYHMFDHSGRLVQTGKVEFRTGVNTIPIGVNNLPAGVYHLQLSSSDGVQQTKFVKN